MFLNLDVAERAHDLLNSGLPRLVRAANDADPGGEVADIMLRIGQVVSELLAENERLDAELWQALAGGGGNDHY